MLRETLLWPWKRSPLMDQKGFRGRPRNRATKLLWAYFFRSKVIENHVGSMYFAFKRLCIISLPWFSTSFFLFFDTFYWYTHYFPSEVSERTMFTRFCSEVHIILFWRNTYNKLWLYLIFHSIDTGISLRTFPRIKSEPVRQSLNKQKMIVHPISN